MTTSRLPVLTEPDTATELRQLLSQSLPTSRSIEDAAGDSAPEEIAYTATAAASTVTTAVFFFSAGAERSRSDSDLGEVDGETTNTLVVGDNDLFSSSEVASVFSSREVTSVVRASFESTLVKAEDLVSSNVRASFESTFVEGEDLVSSNVRDEAKVSQGAETRFSRNTAESLDAPSVSSSGGSGGGGGGGEVLFPSSGRDGAANVASSSAVPRPATDGGTSAARGGLSVSPGAASYRDGDGDVSSVSAPTPPLSDSAPSWSAAPTASATAATPSNVSRSAGAVGGSSWGVTERRSEAGVTSFDVVATVTTESGARDATGTEEVPTTFAPTGAVKHGPTIVSDLPRATDMAGENATTSLQPVNGTTGGSTLSTVTVATGSGDNSTPIDDGATVSASSSGSGGGEEPFNSTSTPFSTSSSGSVDLTVTDSASGSDVLNVTTSDLGILDSSGEASGEVIDTTTPTTVVAGTTSTPPTLSPVVPCSSQPPSTAGNGSVSSGDAGKCRIIMN